MGSGSHRIVCGEGNQGIQKWEGREGISGTMALLQSASVQLLWSKRTQHID